MHRQGELRVRIRRHLDRPVVGAEQHRVLFGEPERRTDPDPGAGFHVARVVLGPELAPARVDDDRVAGLDRGALLLQRGFEILDRDLVIVGQHLDALQAGHVDEHAAPHQHAALVDAELPEARAPRNLISFAAVVLAVDMDLLSYAVTIRYDINELGGPDPLSHTTVPGQCGRYRAGKTVC